MTSCSVLSVIVPVFNEGEQVLIAIKEILEKLVDIIRGVALEIILVDDGSTDNSWEYICRASERDSRVRGIRLSKNEGSHTAIRAGLNEAKGDCAVFLACDLQDSPSDVPRLLSEIEKGSQIVWAVREMRDDTIMTRLFAHLYYWGMRLGGVQSLPPRGASMFMLGPKALACLSQFRERNLTLEGLFSTMGFTQASVLCHRQKRMHGTSKWTLAKKFKLFIDGFIGYTFLPLRIISISGILLSGIGFLYAIFIICSRLIFNTAVQGWPSVMVVLLVVSGIQMTMLGIIGEYLWRALDETRGRPLYFIMDSTASRGEKRQVSGVSQAITEGI